MRTLTAAILATSMSACASDPPPGPVQTEVLYQGSHCGREKESASLRWITEIEPYRESFREISATYPQPMPQVSFNQSSVLLIEMGRKPTAGYGVALRGVEQGGGIVTVRVDWQEPPPDAITAQVITSPCLMLKLPREDYAEIRVVDTEGRERLSE